MGLIDGILTPILSPLLPTGAETTATETPSSTSQVTTSSQTQTTSSTQSSSTSSVTSSSETTSATDSVSSSSSSALSSSESLTLSSPPPSSTSSQTPVVSTTTSGTSVVTVTVSSTTAVPSAPEGAVNSSDPPSTKSFLQNKPLAGAVFGVAGLIALILLITIATMALRRSRRKRDIAHAVSFDPSMMERMTENGHGDDRASVLEKGRNSGGGGSWESAGYSNTTTRYDHLFPAGVPAANGNNYYGGNTGYPQPYGGAAIYGQQDRYAAPTGYHGAYGGEAAPRQPYVDPGHYGPPPPPKHDGWLANPYDGAEEYNTTGRTSVVSPSAPEVPAEGYKAAYSRDTILRHSGTQPSPDGTPKEEEPGMQLKVTNQ